MFGCGRASKVSQTHLISSREVSGLFSRLTVFTEAEPRAGLILTSNSLRLCPRSSLTSPRLSVCRVLQRQFSLGLGHRVRLSDHCEGQSYFFFSSCNSSSLYNISFYTLLQEHPKRRETAFIEHLQHARPNTKVLPSIHSYDHLCGGWS